MCRQKNCGFTLVELMVAMCVSLMLLGGVVSLFGTLGESVNDSKSNSEMLHTMRHAARQLQSDLGNVSLVPDPAETQTNPQGFFEYVEGPFSDENPYDPDAADNEPDLPDPTILDVASAEATSGWNQNNACRKWSFDSSNKRNYSNSMGNKYVTWTKTGLQNGKYRVSLTWPTDWKSNWSDLHFWAVPVTITSGDDEQTVDVDQTQKPSDLADPVATREKDGEPIMWHHLGEIDVTDKQLIVQMGPYQKAPGDPNKHVYADAIRIECLELTGGDTEEGDAATAEMSLVGDCDDVLHFTTKTDEGAHEVVWFLTPMSPYKPGSIPTGSTRYRLHRIQLDVNPQESDLVNTVNLSKGVVLDSQTLRPTTSPPTTQANSLSDLAIRANRWGHINGASEDRSQFKIIPVEEYKKDDTPANLFTYMKALGDDCGLADEQMDHVNWPANEEIYKTWLRETSKTVILENVIGFDVQRYDPEAPIYGTTASNEQTIPLLPTDPGWDAEHQAALAAIANDPEKSTVFELPAGPPTVENPENIGPIGKGAFRDLDPAQADDLNSPLKTLSTADGTVATYDSWSGTYKATYDHDQDSATPEIEIPDSFKVGFDNLPHPDASDGIVDTAEDLIGLPPYDVPLRAVQVEIRVQNPESGKVRSVKIRKHLGKR